MPLSGAHRSSRDCMPVVGVEADYLDAALDEMRTKYGTIEDYFTSALGVDDTIQQALRAAFVED